MARKNVRSENIGDSHGDAFEFEAIDIPAVVELYAPPFGFLANRRQIPDARDGMLPVRRRVLYAAAKLGLSASSRTIKCAGVVGECMAKYHPHGDSSIYGALVNMAQPWAMRYPLVKGQGNFGNVDGDPPAAMRYTEMTLTPLGDLMVADLYGPEQAIVPWVDTYDGERKEPMLLTARFPGLLANGNVGAGMGWGDSSTIHSLNLRELIDGLCLLIDEPKTEPARLAKIIKGPDYAGGGIIVDNSDWLEIMTNGQGKVTVRAKMHIEDSPNSRRGQQQIVVTELPYGVTKAGDKSLMSKIVELVNGDDESRKKGIVPPLANVVSDVHDETSDEGMRLVITLAPGMTPERAMPVLLKRTALQTRYSIKQQVLLKGYPELLGTQGMMENYLEFQFEVLTNRTKYFLSRAERALEQEEAKVIAHGNAEELVRIAKAAGAKADIPPVIMKKFGTTKYQAEYITDLPLYTYAKLNMGATRDRIAALKKEIAEYKRLLGSKKAMGELLKEELRETRAKFGDERRSVIDASVGADIKSFEEMIVDEPCWVVVTTSGLIGRLPDKTFRAQKRGGAGTRGAAKPEEDPILEVVPASTRDRLWAITSAGNLFGLRVADLEEIARGARGTNVRRFLSMAEDERVVKIVVPPAKDSEGELILATRDGRVARNRLSDYANLTSAGLRAIKLVADDRIVSVSLANGSQQLLAISSDGYALRFDIDDVSIQGRGSQGVASQKIGPGAQIVSLTPIDPADKRDLAVVLSNGKGKRSRLSEYPVKGRGSRGQITADMGAAAKKAPAQIVFAAPLAESDEVIFTTTAGKVIRMGATEIKRQGRATGGVQVVGLSASTKNPEAVSGGAVAAQE